MATTVRPSDLRVAHDLSIRKLHEAQALPPSNPFSDAMFNVLVQQSIKAIHPLAHVEKSMVAKFGRQGWSDYINSTLANR